MYKPRENCIYYTKWSKCNHLDRRGLFGAGKTCVLEDKFVKECRERIGHPRPSSPPPSGVKPPAGD